MLAESKRRCSFHSGGCVTRRALNESASDARAAGAVAGAPGAANTERETKPRLLEQVRRACRARQYSPRTAEAYTRWVRRYVLYHHKQHPAELDAAAVTAFLSHLANDAGVQPARPPA
jgi:hypothetical protein